MADKDVKKSGMHGSDTYVTFPKYRRQTTVKVIGNNFQEKYTPNGLTNNQVIVLCQFNHTQSCKKKLACGANYALKNASFRGLFCTTV